MEQSKLIFLQALMMLLLSFVGFILYKTNKITKASSKAVGSILVYVSLPATIFSSFLVERSKEKMIGLGIAFLAALVILVIGMIISKLLNRKDPTAIFACSFANPGFFGIPLIVASLIEGSVFYIAPFISLLNVFQWTFGVYQLTNNKSDISFKRIITAPALIAFLVGLLFFFVQIPLPSMISKAVTYCAQLNTPLAMFSVGIYLAQTNFIGMIKRLSNYKIALIRLVIIPLIALLLLWLIPNEYNDLKTAILIAAACPVGSNIAVLAEMNNADYTYAVETVVVSTLFSIATIPLIVLLSSILWAI